ncbi:MAG: cytochrome P450 [Nocardia sp.]|nr:cytochrome P450 [Nocardia sp.]
MQSSPSDYADNHVQRVPLHGPEFALDPHRLYKQMRERFGSFVPVEMAPGVPATLVIGYRAALAILNDPERFPADPRQWEQGMRADCPMLPAMGWRPTAIRNTGHEHLRLRRVVAAALDDVDLNSVHAVVERTAVPLINAFCVNGSAELAREYAGPLVFSVMNDLVGSPPSISEKAAAGMTQVMDGPDPQEGNRIFEEAFSDLIQFKRTTPGADITSRLLHHGGDLDDEEILQQLVMLYGIGAEPTQSLILAALLLLLNDSRFGADVMGGALSTRDALDQVLFEDPPMSNVIFSYPRQPILVGGVWLPADQPVVISIGGCNNDPEIAGGDRTGNRAHLAWSAGPHSCPATSLGYLIAQCAIDQLLDALPDLELAVPANELQWRPGPIQHALAALPVAFESAPPLPSS